MKQLIPGLQTYEGQGEGAYKGQLDLPKEFDSKKYVGKWVKRGPRVDAAKRNQVIPSEKVVADGWQVWKNAGKGCVRSLGDGAYVLMFRPKELQQALNGIYGNASRRRMMGEANGDTIGGQANEDNGLLSNKTLNRIQSLNAERSDEPVEKPMKFNEVAMAGDAPDTSAPITTNIKPIKSDKPRTKYVLKKT